MTYRGKQLSPYKYRHIFDNTYNDPLAMFFGFANVHTVKKFETNVYKTGSNNRTLRFVFLLF